MKYYKVTEWFMSFYVFALIVFGSTAGQEKFANIAAVLFMGMFGVSKLLTGQLKFTYPTEFRFFSLFAYLAFATLIWSEYSDFPRLHTFLLVLILGFCVLNTIAEKGNLNSIELPLYLGSIYSLVSISLGVYEFEYGRTGGPLGHPNNLGYFIIIVMAFSVRRLIIIDTTPTSYSVLKRAAMMFVMASAMYQLFLFSGSRRAMIICGFSLFYYVYKFLSSKEVKISKKLLFFVPLVAGTIAAVDWLVNSPFFERLTNLLAFASGKSVNEGSVGERSHMIQTAFELWTAKPVIGWGFDAFKSVGGFGVYSHNNFLEILANNGLLGFVLFYAAYVVLAYRIFKLRFKLAVSNTLWLVLCLLAVLMADAGGVNYYSKLFWMIFSAMVGLCVYNENPKRNVL